MRTPLCNYSVWCTYAIDFQCVMVHLIYHSTNELNYVTIISVTIYGYIYFSRIAHPCLGKELKNLEKVLIHRLLAVSTNACKLKEIWFHKQTKNQTNKLTCTHINTVL